MGQREKLNVGEIKAKGTPTYIATHLVNVILRSGGNNLIQLATTAVDPTTISAHAGFAKSAILIYTGGSTHRLYENIGSDTSCTFSLIGVAGSVGPSGPTGGVGSTGPKGSTGIQGPTGPQGETGPQGPSGSWYLIEPTGPQGPTGEGTTGDKGATGTTGPKGSTGERGPTGKDGSTGPKGTTGPKGATGDPSTVTGPMGPTGPKGDTGAGPQGINGVTGPMGPTGAAAGGTGAVQPYNMLGLTEHGETGDADVEWQAGWSTLTIGPCTAQRSITTDTAANIADEFQLPENGGYVDYILSNESGHTLVMIGGVGVSLNGTTVIPDNRVAFIRFIRGAGSTFNAYIVVSA